MIPVFKPHMNTARILPEMEKILNSGWIGLGPKTREFEEKFAARQGVKFGVGVNSCTAALHLAILAAGIREGDEVLVPTMTFASTALVLLYERAVPVFVDCEPDTLCMDPEDARRKITRKTKAIIPVHFGGHAAKLDVLLKLSKDHRLVLIEDCAHAAGGTYQGRPLGGFGNFSCFSFHAVKNLPMGDGGIILTNDREADQKLRRLRWLGIDKDTWSRSGGKYAWRYSINDLGYKYHMNDLMAVIGLAQLETLDEDNRKRARLAHRYTEAFQPQGWFECPVEHPDAGSAWHNYVIKLKEEGLRDDLISFLSSHGISAGVHYEPIHSHNVFKGRSKTGSLPVAEKLWTRLLTLPLFPELETSEQDLVIEQTRQFMTKRLLCR